ncbi:MAG: hypothetical protein COA69_10325 [Robiginitomaculum sp.]|nr:MAG: hypothetical protein COA69_10325 [Robiginitomaculum sp.]
MSPDDILAANLWPWPDPLLKRDRVGNIIFVNAAFLQLYGGRVEDWSGRSVNGWPDPNPQGAQRFETRVGQGPAEIIYDWVESIMADGNTMAIARNVTSIVAAAQVPLQVTPQAGPQTMPQAAPAAQDTQLPEPAYDAPNSVAPEPVIHEAVTPEAVTHEPAAIELVAPEPVAPQPVAETPAPVAPQPVAPPQPTGPSLTSEFEDTLGRPAGLPEGNSADGNQSYKTIVAAQPAPAPTPESQEAPMIQRRALPIEDTENVLGTNWRDQVIAKAIGAEVPAEGDTADTASSGRDDTQTSAKVGDGLQILLAEDNAINALLTRTLLEADGAIVTTVEDGALAVEAVRNNDYDLIFMDMRMPNMDGLESTRKIRALGKTMPIVALTANAFDDDRNACFDSGMNDFMTKPVSAEELTEMVVTWVKNSKEQQKLAS